MIDWQLQYFEELSTRALFDILSLRQRVFILEQQCLYPDIDAVDLEAQHLAGYVSGQSDGNGVCAYLRLIKPRTASGPCSLGRIVSSPEHRGQGLGKQLVQHGISAANKTHPGSCIKVSAQQHLEAFYQGFGFHTSSAPYDEDGISHIDMLRPA